MAALKVSFFTVFLIGLFIWLGAGITRVSGEGASVRLGVGLSVENGEQIFWGPGKCSTCHSIGPRGSTVRGPNLGESRQGPELAIRAAERAAQRALALGHDVTGTEYLIESIAEPSAYVVDGFKDEMPRVYDPPISLGPDQIASVIMYLQTIGGAPDPSAIVLPPVIREATSGRGGADAWAPYLAGDSILGRALFFDLDGPAPCSKCHSVNNEGGDVGPDLTAVAGVRTAQFIVEAILEPSAEIAGGYESVLIQTTDGRILDGVIRRETQDSVWLADGEGIESALATTAIARRRVQETSLMPEDFARLLTVAELHDLLAYLGTLR